MSTYPIRAREDKAWQDGYKAGRRAALAELHTALDEIKSDRQMMLRVCRNR
jgi:hypothetical protein